MDPMEALERLREGNRRYAAGVQDSQPASLVRREALVSGQAPFATILGCSDSRVPPEFVFDEGLGELFVVRVAGNVAASVALASIEFAVAHLGTKLVVVLAHQGCGAVQAAVTAQTPDTPSPGHLAPFLKHIEPVAQRTAATHSSSNAYSLVESVERENARAAAQTLRTQSPILSAAIQDQELKILEARYSVATGVVDFFGEEMST